MNRPAYHNLDVCHLQAVLFLCILAACTLPQLRKFSFRSFLNILLHSFGKISFCALSLSVLLVLTLGTTVQYAYNSDIKKNYHDMAELQEFADTIASEIPPHTYGFGVSVSEIYSLLGWSTNCFTLDFADLSVRPQVADYVIQDIQEKRSPGSLPDRLPSKNGVVCPPGCLLVFMNISHWKENMTSAAQPSVISWQKLHPGTKISKQVIARPLNLTLRERTMTCLFIHPFYPYG